ncbi:uncharacterized protein BO97DRAFT_463378 [Aspergillus homomorphus CBS 101889]|uniref:Uncharacterized protein n=1 Tax=Aspergillus homomorphus (strain CBS 101889) TaxID=1450537 RepID=A0A395HLB9_ASPHC|nr:hypothetical protein BO97DRAFT_463378 [Aspergillus homomorphus CBS 101889]RAL07668.1 hypothetical protein BO97DRAFT_463378 [Aspergillus homomorphus CBS 101889]
MASFEYSADQRIDIAWVFQVVNHLEENGVPVGLMNRCLFRARVEEDRLYMDPTIDLDVPDDLLGEAVKVLRNAKFDDRPRAWKETRKLIPCQAVSAYQGWFVPAHAFYVRRGPFEDGDARLWEQHDEGFDYDSVVNRRGDVLLQLFRHSDYLWNLPAPTLGPPAPDDRFYDLITLDESTAGGSTGGLTAKGIRLARYAESMVLLCLRDKTSISAGPWDIVWPQLQNMAREGHEEQASWWAVSAFRPFFQELWRHVLLKPEPGQEPSTSPPSAEWNRNYREIMDKMEATLTERGLLPDSPFPMFPVSRMAPILHSVYEEELFESEDP